VGARGERDVGTLDRDRDRDRPGLTRVAVGISVPALKEWAAIVQALLDGR
jgi:hypothetical protein